MRNTKVRPLRVALVVGVSLFIGACSNGQEGGVGRTASALTVSGIFPTGVDDTGALLPNSSADTHYTLVASADPAFTVPASTYVVDATAYPIVSGPWVAEGPSGQWIGVQSGNNGNAAAGSYTYELKFDLAGVDPMTAQISGMWACDDSCTMLLNGQQVAVGGGFTTLSPLSIPAGTTAFVAGTNTLDIVVINNTGPTGFRIESITTSGEQDAGNLDGGDQDGGTNEDAGDLDASDQDGGINEDAGVVDASDADGGANDGGIDDAGVKDGGSADASTNDAGATDGGNSGSDGGSSQNAQNEIEGGGISCAMSPGSNGNNTAMLGIWLFAGLAFIRRRRHD